MKDFDLEKWVKISPGGQHASGGSLEKLWDAQTIGRIEGFHKCAALTEAWAKECAEHGDTGGEREAGQKLINFINKLRGQPPAQPKAEG